MHHVAELMILAVQNGEFGSSELDGAADFWKNVFNVVYYVILSKSFLLESFFNYYTDIFFILDDFLDQFCGHFMGLYEVNCDLVSCLEFIELPLPDHVADDGKLREFLLEPGDRL